MFSGSFMVIAVLVVFASQAKAESSTLLVVPSSLTTTTATPASSATIGGLLSSVITTATPPSSTTIGGLLSTAKTSGVPAATLPTGTLTLPLPSPSPSTTTTGTSSPTLTSLSLPPTNPPSPKQTCGNLSLVITKEWDESYLDWSSKVIFSITVDIPNLFNDTKKYASPSQNILDLTKKDGYIGMTVKLCIEVKTDDADSSVIDVLHKLNKTGTLGNMKVKEHSVTFKEIGVKLGGWEVQNDDECKKCSKGGGGPFVIKRACTSITQSCKGLKTKKSDKCEKYCGACAAVAISSFTLIMGIILSFSFNIWK